MPHNYIIKEIPSFFVAPSEIFALFKDKPYSFFLDSSQFNPDFGRFSFLGFDPKIILKSKSDTINITEGGKVRTFKGNPFDEIKKILEEHNMRPNFKKSGLPFLGGAVGYLGYELKNFLEDLPQRSKDDLNLPDTTLGFYDTVIISDNLNKKMYLAGLKTPGTLKKIVSIENIIRDFKTEKTPLLKEIFKASLIFESGFKSNFTKSNYFGAVEKIKEYIRAGDVYQVNLSQRFEGLWHGDPFYLYKSLRFINPAPMAAYLNYGDIKLISSSPERYLKIDARYVETRPIKGTRPRGKNKAEDATLKKELLKSIKDKAEHLMIVDLERNDLGRCCEFNSVFVKRLMALEEYETVFHLVSTVAGTLKKDVGPIELLKNTFPGGSITGAPKIRSMEIIDELEPNTRGVYTGAIGYIGYNGNMDLSIPIRTITIKDNRFYFNVGGGIVSDSDPEAEYQETLDKGRALATALERANTVSDSRKSMVDSRQVQFF